MKRAEELFREMFPEGSESFKDDDAITLSFGELYSLFERVEELERKNGVLAVVAFKELKKPKRRKIKCKNKH